MKYRYRIVQLDIPKSRKKYYLERGYSSFYDMHFSTRLDLAVETTKQAANRIVATINTLNANEQRRVRVKHTIERVTPLGDCPICNADIPAVVLTNPNTSCPSCGAELLP